MTDTEALNLIEHYGWSIAPQVNGGWVIEGDDGSGEQEIELARTRGPLREAIADALKAQMDWALGVS